MGALPLASLLASLEDGKNRPTDRPLKKGHVTKLQIYNSVTRPTCDQVANLQLGNQKNKFFTDAEHAGSS